LALCIYRGCLPFEPQTGAIYRVVTVHYEAGLCGLEIDGVPNDPGFDGWEATGFRKITPGAQIEGIEVERRLPVREDV
jgi:hypothetical protein